MLLRLLAASCLLLVSLVAPACAQSSSAAPGKDFDLQGFIDGKLAAGEKRVVVPPGQYRVTPQRGVHLRLRGLRDVEIVARGVEMICTQTTQALVIEDCVNVTVSGLTIDYDPLPFTQGRIVKLSEDKRVQEIELFDGYPTSEYVVNFKFQIYNQDTLKLQAPDYGLASIEKPSPKRLILTKTRGSSRDPEEVGNIIVIGAEHAPGGQGPHAVIAERCVNLRLESINLYASNCFGFLENHCDATVYQDCFIGRRAPEQDLRKRALKRVRSLNADAYHSKHAVRGPQLIRSQASYMADDGLNITGDYHMVMGAPAPKTLRVLAKHDMNIEQGDGVELLSYEGVRLPDAKVVSIRPDAAITEDEVAFLRAQQMNDGLRTNQGGALSKGYLVTLDRDVPMSRGSLIASTNRIGNGFLVQDCKFGFNRSRGILIKASHGRVVGNTIQNAEMAGIQIIPEFWWLESGSSSDLVVSGNRIINCGSFGLELTASGGDGKVAPAGAHRDITITGNTFIDCPLPNLVATSTQGLVLKDNRYEKVARDRRIGDWLLRRYGLDNNSPLPNEVLLNNE